MLSGGEEGVLAVWQIATGARTFLPRLGAAIVSLAASTDGQLYAVGTADRTVRFLRAAGLRMVAVARGVARDGSQPAAVIEDPRSHTAVVPAGRGALQWIDTKQDAPLMDLQVAMAGPYGAVSHVTHAAFSKDGGWLVTAERRRGAHQEHSALSFWRWDINAHTYLLAARLDRPHRTAISALAYHPAKDVVVTASTDGRFYVWKCASGKAWRCGSSGMYRGHAFHAAAFSADGSLLALAAGQSVTLWEAESALLHGVLSATAPTEVVTHLAFVAGRPALAAATREHVFMWDLTTLSITWSARLQVAAMAAGPAGTVALASGSVVLEVAPESARPLHVLHAESTISALAYVGGELVALDASQLVVPLAGTHHAPTAPSAADKDATQQQPVENGDAMEIDGGSVAPAKAAAPQSKLAALFGPTATESAAPAPAQHQLYNPVIQPLSVLDAPSHTLPPPNLLFAALVRARLKPAPQQVHE